ncbi:MAG: CNNM domain-containing protein [Opitutales bacterium]
MLLLAVFLALAIGVSFLCSILEAVFLSVTPSSVEALRRQRPEAARRIARLREDPDRPLAAILTLNTISHTVGAAGVGAQAERIWGSTSLAIVSAIVTLLILVFSEIIPKTLGALYWRPLMIPTTRVIQWLVWICLPFVWLAQGITHWLSRGRSQAVRRDELSAMAEAGRLEGTFSEDEARVVRNLVEQWRKPVHEILTPRTVVAALSADQTIAASLQEGEKLSFSRLPVYVEQIDQLKGYVLRGELQAAHGRGESERPVSDFLRPIYIVPETATVSAVCRQMVSRREHIAAAVDEYGSLAGLVTMEDILETLLGEEIVDEYDTIVDLREWARQSARSDEEDPSPTPVKLPAAPALTRPGE